MIQKIILTIFIFNIYKFDKCLQVEECICANNGANCLSEKNIPKDLISYFNFDNSSSVDAIGNFSISPFPVGGPGKNKEGFSLNFKENSIYELSNSTNINSEITLMFWIFIRRNSSKWTSILYDKLNRFSLHINPKTGNLKLIILQNNKKISFLTFSSLIYNKWNHISIVFTKNLIKISVNGVKDKEKKYEHNIKVKDFKFMLGSNNIYNSALMFLDEFKIWNRKLEESEIFDNFNNYYNDYQFDDYKIICSNCTYMKTLNGCGDNYHICDLSEIYTGVFQFARSNGLLKNNKEIWFKIKDSSNIINSKEKKLGICCKNN